MKRFITLVLSLSLALSLAACSQGTGASGSTGSGSSASDIQPSASAPSKVFECVAALHTTAGGIEEQAVQDFASKVAEGTNGGIDIQVFAGASLGTEQENLTQIKTNEVQFVLFGDVFLSQLLQDYNATSIPFVYSDIESAVGYWESISDTVDEIVGRDGNMYIVGREYRAPRQLTANKEINTPADLAGLKLRVPETTFYLTVWGGLGAIATPVNWSEIFTALQTKVADAQENPVETYYTAGLAEVQSHTMLTSHINTFYTWTVNCDFYDSLPDDYKTIWDECAKEVLDEYNAGLMERQNAIMQIMESEGHTFVEVDTGLWRETAMDSILECAETLAPTAKEAVYEQLGI